MKERFAEKTVSYGLKNGNPCALRSAGIFFWKPQKKNAVGERPEIDLSRQKPFLTTSGFVGLRAGQFLFDFLKIGRKHEKQGGSGIFRGTGGCLDYTNDPDGKVSSKKKADMEFDQDKFGLFFQNQLFFGDNIELNFGVRWDDVSYDVSNKNGDEVDVSHTKYPWSVAPAYHWNQNATTYVSVGKSYWYPAPFYYQSAMEYMNPENLPEDLKPEESLTYEIGHKQRIARWANVNLTLFYIEYKDKYAVFYDSSQSYAGYKNTGDSEHIGVELEMNGRVTDYLGYRLSGTYMDAEWTSGRERVYTWETPTSRDFRDLDGYQLNRVPEYKYMIGIDIFPIENLRCNMDLNVTGPYYVDYFNRIEYGERCTVDFGIRYDKPSWSIWLLGKNIFDKEIESVYNSNGQLNTSDEDILLNGPYANEYHPRQGQYFEGGVTLRF